MAYPDLLITQRLMSNSVKKISLLDSRKSNHLHKKTGFHYIIFVICSILIRINICFRTYNEQNKKPWISIYVQGFSDAPLAWDNEEQNFFTSGDNSYTIIFDQSNCLFCIQKTSRKRYK